MKCCHCSLFILLLLLCGNSYGQNQNAGISGYYRLINKYLICKADSDENCAYRNLKAAVDSYGLTWYSDDLIRYELKYGHRKAALAYAKKTVLAGMQYFNETLEDLIHSGMCEQAIALDFGDTIFTTELANQYPDWRKEYLHGRSEYYQLLNFEIQRRTAAEQHVRVYIHSNDSTAWHYTDEADSMNYFFFKDLILTRGFPDRGQLDSRSWRNFDLMLLHFMSLDLRTGVDSSERRWLDSTLWSQVLTGNFYPSMYATYIDRYQCFKTRKTNKHQIYGEFNWDDHFNHIIDIENVDKRRSEKFLVPLKYKAKIDNLPLPEGYRFKE